MTRRELTKSEKRKLRALAGEAYARELDAALQDLASLFTDWRQKRIDGFQLSEAIHAFHQGSARTLYSSYTRLDPGFLVARAISRRLLEESEVPEPLLRELESLIAHCRESSEDREA